MPAPRSNEAWDGRPDRQRSPLAITDGEINFLWSFIQGSLMNVETWRCLLNGYGFCERHAWVHLNVEMAFREQYLLGPTILYAALIEKALNAVGVVPAASRRFVERRLRAGEACLLCTLNVISASRGACPQRRLDQGRDTRPLQWFALDLKQLWSDYVCDACKRKEGSKPNNGEIRCRRHLIADLRAHRPVNLLRQQVMLRDLHERVIRYQESFTAGKPEANDQERASLVAAVGWCSGWRPLLALLDDEQSACSVY